MRQQGHHVLPFIIAGVMQGMMWRETNVDGTLANSFIQSVKATYPFYKVRLLGGVLYLLGMLLMAYNVARTIASGKPVDAPVVVPAAQAA